ncbi:hypothetical protein PsYK624_061280 [Phanerochaete sordida]|uniref:Uncharacterized protein n=1 Tax=Phanerochaete sordida TaxID=48140 RepID=A0A9P3G680_9APHY|nr:hypothetical protein PsYK624_061280 [Phanerochaete sordida]
MQAAACPHDEEIKLWCYIRQPCSLHAYGKRLHPSVNLWLRRKFVVGLSTKRQIVFLAPRISLIFCSEKTFHSRIRMPRSRRPRLGFRDNSGSEQPHHSTRQLSKHSTFAHHVTKAQPLRDGHHPGTPGEIAVLCALDWMTNERSVDCPDGSSPQLVSCLCSPHARVANRDVPERPFGSAGNAVDKHIELAMPIAAGTALHARSTGKRSHRCTSARARVQHPPPASQHPHAGTNGLFRPTSKSRSIEMPGKPRGHLDLPATPAPEEEHRSPSARGQ